VPAQHLVLSLPNAEAEKPVAFDADMEEQLARKARPRHGYHGAQGIDAGPATVAAPAARRPREGEQREHLGPAGGGAHVPLSNGDQERERERDGQKSTREGRLDPF